MDININRYGSTPFGTFGELIINDNKFYTVERPWLNNEREKSCIPAGEYRLEKHVRQNGNLVVALVNEEIGIYHYPNEKAKRDLILLHPANTMDDVIGCIGIGEGLGFIKNKWAITKSRKSTEYIMRLLYKENYNKLTIKWKGIEQ